MFSTATQHPPTPSADDSTLRAVEAQLRRRGWQARIDTYDVGGESDERLVVEQAGERCVELLGPWGNVPCGAEWHAVHVASEARVVWCGPPHACEPTDLVRFVEDLLSRDPVQLAGHYKRLG